MGARAAVKSAPELVRIADGGSRLTAYVRRFWPTFYRLAQSTTDSDEAARNLAAVALAHTGAETAHGLALYGWNFGNLTGAADYFERNDTKPRETSAGVVNDPIVLRFAWFPNETKGAAAYYRTIRDAPRYAGAWWRAVAGSPSYLPELRSAGYFTGRSWVHPGESLPRLDTDAELAAAFGKHLDRVRSDVAILEGNPQRRQTIGIAIVGSVVASAVLSTVVYLAAAD